MNILFYSTKNFEQPYIQQANNKEHTIKMIPDALSVNTAEIAAGFDAISIFAGDDASAPVIEKLHAIDVKYITIRAAGYDNTDINRATQLGIKLANVPNYSPHAIAEHAVAMMLALSRKLVLADKQVHQHNFTIDNLIGFNLNDKTVGIIGTGKIGMVVARILRGFGCNIIAYDVKRNNDLENKYGVLYTSLETLCMSADIISIHTPLNEQTKYLINNDLIQHMQQGVMIINTARGAIVNTADIISNLNNGHIGYYGMDVYEKEKAVFFYDHSSNELNDEQLKQLMAMPNVLITPHQGFATVEALQNIAATTMYNINCWENDMASENELPARPVLQEA